LALKNVGLFKNQEYRPIQDPLLQTVKHQEEKPFICLLTEFYQTGVLRCFTFDMVKV